MKTILVSLLTIVATSALAQTTCQTIGNNTFCSDGTSYNRIGNMTFGSDGSSAQRIGNQTFINPPAPTYSPPPTYYQPPAPTYQPPPPMYRLQQCGYTSSGRYVCR